MLRQSSLSLTLALGILLVLCPSAFAQTVSGTIFDASGAAISGAEVALQSGATHRAAISREDGSFYLRDIPVGQYELTVSSTGFQSFTQPISAQPGKTVPLRIVLQIAVKQQSIDVDGGDAGNSPAHNQGGVVLKGQSLSALATDPMQLKLELQTMAGANSGTQFLIDGFSANRLPPKSAIQEIRINDNPYSVQWDTTGLGRVEIATKPGADTLHGTLSLTGEDSNLNSQNPFVATQPDYSAFYAEGNASSRIGAHSSWLVDGDVQTAGSQSFIHTVTSATGPIYSQAVSSPRTAVDIGPRLDFQLGKKQTVTLHYQFGHQEQDNLVQNPALLATQSVDTRHTDQALELSDTQVLSAKFLNETRFQFLHTNDSTVSRDSSYSVLVEGAFDGGGNLLGQLHDGQNHYLLEDISSLSLGNHLLRFGGRLRDIQDGNSSTTGFNGQFIFSSIESYTATEQGLAEGLTLEQLQDEGYGPSQYARTAGTPNMDVNMADGSVFFEDQWRLRPSMTLTPGMRFESQTGIADHADFAPRLAYAWGIPGGKNHAPFATVHAGVGVFYSRVTPDLLLNARRLNGVNQQQYVVNYPDFFSTVPPIDHLGSATFPTVYRLSSRLSAPHIVQESFGIDKNLWGNLSVSVNYAWLRGVEQLLTRNANAPLEGTYDPSDPASGTRPLGTLQNIYTYESEGTTKQSKLSFNVRLTTKPLIFFARYTYGHSHADTAGANSFPSNQYDLHQDYGRAATDIQHRFYLGGAWHLPYGIELYPFLILQSGLPFNITTGTDLNGDSQFNDRPAFATDLTRTSVYRTKWGNFDTHPLTGQKITPVNYGTGPSVAMLNMSFSKNIGVGPMVPAETPGGAPSRKYLLNLGMEGQNMLNTLNGSTPIGVLGSRLFGQSTALASTQYSSPEGNRILYLTMRFDF